MVACSHCQSKISDFDADVTVTGVMTVRGTMIAIAIYFIDLLSQTSSTVHIY